MDGDFPAQRTEANKDVPTTQDGARMSRMKGQGYSQSGAREPGHELAAHGGGRGAGNGGTGAPHASKLLRRPLFGWLAVGVRNSRPSPAELARTATRRRATANRSGRVGGERGYKLAGFFSEQRREGLPAVVQQELQLADSSPGQKACRCVGLQPWRENLIIVDRRPTACWIRLWLWRRLALGKNSACGWQSGIELTMMAGGQCARWCGSGDG
ncbi:hypothetical protein B0J11DRAFT_505748 [Dendryphion nanum]|uniref:Uncharacterized protein n=1 Tax=Dendryphion nanum TaxID=256645 RepID=A0A9P9INF8_9PLEO|nr:hypothetical protein B0J11DRAFT_505748 [Dendryphion nanum]